MYTFHEHMPDNVLRRLESYRMLRNAAEHIRRKEGDGSTGDVDAYVMLMRRSLEIKDSLEIHWSDYREGLPR